MAPSEELEAGVSEYLCTLQPHRGSQLAQALLARRTSCELAGLGVDSAWLYPPHVSVTGFFTATKEQAELVCELARSELERAQAAESEAHGIECTVEVRKVLTTETGHVLLDVEAPSVAKLSSALAERAKKCGVGVRPKAVRHLSLAAGRSDPGVRCAIADFHKGLPLEADAGWELVVAQLVKRSDVEALQSEGRRHHFSDLLRLPVSGNVRYEGPQHAVLLAWPSPICKWQASAREARMTNDEKYPALMDCMLCNETPTDADMDCSLCNGTPMKKRPWAWSGADNEKGTPPKLTKVASTYERCVKCKQM